MNFIAKIDFDSALPLIIGLIWVIAQVAGAAAKKKNAATRPSSMKTNNEEPAEDPFAALMRKIGGVQEFKIPDPSGPPRSELRSTTGEPKKVKADRSWKPDDVKTLPDVKPIRREAAIPEPKPIQAPLLDAHPKMSSFKSAMPSIKLPAMKLSLQGSGKSGSGVLKIGKIINPADKQTLRRAVLGHIILSKPKALEGWSSGTVE